MMARGEIAARFAAAANGYDRHAGLQLHAAATLAARIEAAFAERPPARILEFGCGTGLLSAALRRRFPDALLVCTDLVPGMLRRCRDRLGQDGRTLFAAADLARPAFAGGFDLVCSSLALQWLERPDEVLAGLARLLGPGGRLMVATLAEPSLQGWQAAHAAEGVGAGSRLLPGIGTGHGAGPVAWDRERVLVPHEGALAFMRSLRGLGADRPRDGHRPLGPGRMRRVMRRFEREHAAVADWTVAYGRRDRAMRRGVFVSGTDTEIGKTLVAACLVRAWGAEYWKPFQTGLDADPGDSATVRRLAGIGPERIHRPLLELRAPLAPAEAGRMEGRRYDPSAFRLPAPLADGDPVLVVEGAGGALVPLDDRTLLADELPRLALPVVLVARSTLGTINHTLLTIEALRARGLPPPLVVLSGPPSPGNRAAIERHSGVRVLAELPRVDRVDADAVAALARLIPPFATLGF